MKKYRDVALNTDAHMEELIELNLDEEDTEIPEDGTELTASEETAADTAVSEKNDTPVEGKEYAEAADSAEDADSEEEAGGDEISRDGE